MSVPLRSGSMTWRRAATVVLAAGCSRPGPSADGFRLLLLERADNQRFLPGAHVFPGGTLDAAADGSADWLPLFKPRYTPPRFGLGPAPPRPPSFPGLPDDRADAGALPDDVALRICAVRETFEEAGVLLLKPRGSAGAAGAAGAAAGAAGAAAAARDAPGPGRALTLPPGRALTLPPGLEDWRSRVRRDPRDFVRLCAHLDCTPDIWALGSWGGWITPYGLGSRRFDASFFLCCLQDAPRVDPDRAEVVGYKWLSPSEATERFLSKEIWLAPPQFYELRRLETFPSLSALYRFSSDHPSEITEKWLQIKLLTANGSINLLPGDELYVNDSNFLEKPMSTDKKTEEIVKEGKVVNRMVIHNSHLYEIYVSLPSENERVYPKNYVVDQKLPAHL